MDQDSWREGSQVESVHAVGAQQAPRLGIGRVVHLEAAIEQITVDLVRPNTSTDIIGSFQNQHIEAGSTQSGCGCEPGEPGANDDDIGVTAHAGDGNGLEAGRRAGIHSCVSADELSTTRRAAGRWPGRRI